MLTNPQNPPIPLTRRDYFSLQFALRLMQVQAPAPGKLAVPRRQVSNEFNIKIDFGLAVRLADDLGSYLDSQPPAPPLEVKDPEPQPPTN